jgi:hypothetical protein
MLRRSRQTCRCWSEPCPARSGRCLRSGREPPQPRARARSGMRSKGTDHLALPAHPRLPHRVKSARGRRARQHGQPPPRGTIGITGTRRTTPDHRDSQSLRKRAIGSAGIQSLKRWAASIGRKCPNGLGDPKDPLGLTSTHVDGTESFSGTLGPHDPDDPPDPSGPDAQIVPAPSPS